MIFLGIDPGLASLGVAVVEKSVSGLRVVALDVLRTAKSPAKRGVLQSEDTTERLRALHRGLDDVIDLYSPVAVCMESFSPPRSASVAAKCGMAVGLVVGLAADAMPIFQASPQAIRRRFGLPRGATKQEVWAAVDGRLARSGDVRPVWALAWPPGKVPPTSQQEHALDALAVAVACAPEVVG